MNYAALYIDTYRDYARVIAAGKDAREEAETEFKKGHISKDNLESKLAAILKCAPKESELRAKEEKVRADFDKAYAEWIAPDGSKVNAADLAVLNPTFITSAADLQYLADKYRTNPTMCKPIFSYAVEKGLNIHILDVKAPLRAMDTLKVFVQKACNDITGYSSNCLMSDKFCQKFIDMMDVMEGKELLTNTIEE